MPFERVIICSACGAEISPDVPEYFIELECYRLLNEREGNVPRRGSEEYHAAMAMLMPEIRETYFHNPEMYQSGHLWCPACGFRLDRPEG